MHQQEYRLGATNTQAALRDYNKSSQQAKPKLYKNKSEQQSNSRLELASRPFDAPTKNCGESGHFGVKSWIMGKPLPLLKQ